MREDIDCGIINYECRICKTSFSRAKDAAYHEKKCGKCTCSIIMQQDVFFSVSYEKIY